MRDLKIATEVLFSAWLDATPEQEQAAYEAWTAAWDTLLAAEAQEAAK